MEVGLSPQKTKKKLSKEKFLSFLMPLGEGLNSNLLCNSYKKNYFRGGGSKLRGVKRRRGLKWEGCFFSRVLFLKLDNIFINF
jgi:hypothetical protein